MKSLFSLRRRPTQRRSHELMWRENLDTTVGIQCEKIGVSCDDVCCIAAHGDFEELIVFRITTGCNRHAHFDPFSPASQGGEEVSNILFINVAKEFSSAQDLREFRERCE